MHFYRLKAVENYKDAFKLIHTTKKKRFNSRLYFYCVNNGIDSLTIAVDSSRVPPIVAEGQSHAELPKELWDRTKYTERYKRATLFKSYQSNISHVAQLGRREQSYLTRTESPYSPFWVRGKGKEYIQLPAAPSF